MFKNSLETISSAYPVIKESLPQSALGYKTNNKYPEFPPLMSDGRAVTASYQPEAVLNEKLLRSNNIQSNWQYRRYLTKHANEIMEYNFREASNDAGYFARQDDVPSSQSNKILGVSSTPYLYSSSTDLSNPKTSDLHQQRKDSAPAGLTSSWSMIQNEINTAPEGRFPMFSDLKEIYLSREQLDARRISPVVTQDEFLRR
jgi:hypothetical protein